MFSPAAPKRDIASTSTTEQKSLVRKSSSAQSSVVGSRTSLDSVEDILKLIRLLYSISTTSMEEFGENGMFSLYLSFVLWKFVIAKFSIRKLGSSSELIMYCLS